MGGVIDRCINMHMSEKQTPQYLNIQCTCTHIIITPLVLIFLYTVNLEIFVCKNIFVVDDSYGN